MAYRPPGWLAAGRAGAVQVPADAEVLLVEGVGSARARLAALACFVVWVQADLRVARARGVVRDIALGRAPEQAERVWDLWAGHERPHFATDRPWARARLVLDGAPPAELPAGTFRVHPVG